MKKKFYELCILSEARWWTCPMCGQENGRAHYPFTDRLECKGCGNTYHKWLTKYMSDEEKYMNDEEK